MHPEIEDLNQLKRNKIETPKEKIARNWIKEIARKKEVVQADIDQYRALKSKKLNVLEHK
jgi:hypothetical protein